MPRTEGPEPVLYVRTSLRLKRRIHSLARADGRNDADWVRRLLERQVTHEEARRNGTDQRQQRAS